MTRNVASGRKTEHIRQSLMNIKRTKDLRLTQFHHHYLVLHHLYLWMQTVALPHARGILLDYGCGGRPYESLFLSKVDKYIAADVATAADTHVDLLLEPDAEVPLPNASCDTILATQTLEHVSNPSFYISECYRLLKPGGILILSAPMSWRHHEAPYDYHRFTRFALEHHLTEHAFEIKNLTPCGGCFALMGQILLNHLCRRQPPPSWIIWTLNKIFSLLDRWFPDQDETINWMCLAQKPSIKKDRL